MVRVAGAYFECFHRQLIRTVVANTAKENISLSDLAEELHALVEPMSGIIVVRELTASSITKELCGFQARMSHEDCLDYLNEMHIAQLDLFDGTDIVNKIPNRDNLDMITIQALDDLMDQLRAEQLEDCSLNGSVEELTKRRKSRKKLNTSLLSPTDSAAKAHRFSNIFPRDIEIVSSLSCLACSDCLSAPSTLTDTEQELLENSMAMKVDQLHRSIKNQHVLLESHTSSYQEYQELLSIYATISKQSDKTILSKLSNLEEYEERMRKLGAQLKNSISTEELFKNLVKASH